MSKNEDKELLRNSISKLEDEINMVSEEINIDPENYFPNPTDLPGLDLDIKIFDYEGEIEKIKLECKETLTCLSSLYITDEISERKNVYNIIQNDASMLSDLKFSLSMSKRGLINLMTQIDAGVNHPEMYEAVATFQKEIRETVKMLYETQKKMKEFYKELKNELSEINIGDDSQNENPKLKTETLSVTDTKMINKIIEQFKDNPNSFFEELNKKK